MSETVTIPFRHEFKRAMLNGIKTATSRTKRYGWPCDIFTAFGEQFRLRDVYKETLISVKHKLWKEEGCASPEDFERVWKAIHPKAGFVEMQSVWVHRFEKVSRCWR